VQTVILALRRTTICRNSLDEWLVRRRDLCLYKTQHSRRASKSLAGFEPANPASERPQTHILDRPTRGFGFDRFTKAHFQNRAGVTGCETWLPHWDRSWRQILQRLQAGSKTSYGKVFKCFRGYAAKCFLMVGLCRPMCVLMWYSTWLSGFSGSSPVLLAIATFLKSTPCIHTKSSTKLQVSITSVMKLAFIKASKNLSVDSNSSAPIA